MLGVTPQKLEILQAVADGKNYRDIASSLNEQTCATSKQLAQWCERNRNRCYIPEWLLKQLGLSVDADSAA
jgi:hypothetical protein